VSTSNAAVIARIDHVNIVVDSMDRSVQFYRDVLGLAKGFEGVLHGDWIDHVTGIPGADALCVFMESAGVPVRLELLEYRNPSGDNIPAASLPNTQGIRHLAFVVPDLDAFHQRALSAGATFVSPPVTVPFPLPGGLRKRLCYFHDPDGVLLEAAEYWSGGE